MRKRTLARRKRTIDLENPKSPDSVCMTNDGIEARRMANDDAWTIKIPVLLG